MSLPSFLRHRLSSITPVRRAGGGACAAHSRRTTRHRLFLEPLEERTVFSVVPYVVTSLADSGPGTLRDAIFTADNDLSNSYLIDFSVTGSINLQSVLPPLESNITIQGPGAGSLAVQQDGAFVGGLFDVLHPGTVKISGMTMAGYEQAFNGGGIYNDGSTTITSCTLTDNTAITGGAITNLPGASLTVMNSTFSGNSANAGFGGAIDNYGSAGVTNCAFANNSATDNGDGAGGAIANEAGANITLIDSTFGANSTDGAGGGIFNFAGGTIDVAGCTFNQNGAGSGGGIDNDDGMAAIANCTFSNDGARFGGGLNNDPSATATVTGCTFTNNAADLGGGINNAGSANVANCTLSGNAANGDGGGILNEPAATATLTNCTLAGNSAEFGGGVFYAGRLTLNNTIVAATVSGQDVYEFGAGTLLGSHNLVDDGSDGLPDTIVANPLLGPLADNGGNTQTMALLPGSPAIDAGSNALAVDASGDPLTTDERGVARIISRTVDIGAFESRPFTIAIMSGTGQSTTVDISFLNPLVAAVTSPYGDPVQGGIITFRAPGSGAGATFSAGPGSTATATIDPTCQAEMGVAANTVAGSYAITAAARGASLSSGFSLSNLPSTAATIKAVAGTPQSTTVGYAFAAPLQVLVTDAYGNPVPGVTVTFTAPTSGAASSFSGGVVVTNALGIAATTCSANIKAGRYAVTASASGVGTPLSFSLTNTPDVASRLLITAPLTAIRNTSFAFTVTALDQYGNIAAGYLGTVAFASTDLKAGLPANYTFVASDHGVHSFNATFGTVGAQALRASDTVTASLTSAVTMIVSAKPSMALATTNASPSGVAPAASSHTARVHAHHHRACQTAGDRHRVVTLHGHA
jgi:hypothetical protein